ncbi:hypothetical protein LSG16_11610 [Lactococcus cremoris]|uniref:hypothetical protein n=1 Tax=Lactococcus lactis subsp. cremoris TaxID=1359 RepID=UPI001E36239B|nr:hypothetical protein [Lactococcus cremoris]MCD6633474.1 hypothetical protein [Lactococcus cremoris]
MKTKQVYVSLMASAILISVASPLMANADIVSSNVTTEQISSNQASNFTDIKDHFDSYVSVKNNQYVLNLPENVQVNQNEFEQVVEQINAVNQQVQTNKLIINPVNKEIVSRASTLKSSGYTFDTFWWGARYYFRSNAAVYQMDHDLDNYTLGFGGVGVLAAIFSGGIAAAVAGAAGLYFQKMKSDLDYYNNTHLNNYINMDVDRTGYYSIYAV